LSDEAGSDKTKHEAAIHLPQEFYVKCADITARFLLTHGITEAKLRKLAGQS
jgi:hypothetical protein